MKKILTYILIMLLIVGTVGLSSCENFIIPEEGHQHTWVDNVVAPTCIAGGYTQRSCTGCDISTIVNETDPTGNHTYVITDYPANCITVAYRESKCSACNHTEIEEIGNTFGDHKNEYSFDTGAHWKKCIFCSKCEEGTPHSLDANGACSICDFAPQTYTITISYANYNAEYINNQIQKFNESQQIYKVVAEFVDASSTDIVFGNVDAPDIFLYDASDTTQLVSMGLLASQSGSYASSVVSTNLSAAIDIVSHNGLIYGYPLGIGNIYFLYYDKSVVSNPESLEDIIADCEKAGKLFSFKYDQMFHVASFFNATGCYTKWITDSRGNLVDVESNYNSSAGLTSLLGLRTLIFSECLGYYRYDSNISDFAAIVSDAWDYDSMYSAFGDNLEMATLPCFTVDGESYKLSPLVNYLALGIRPQKDKNLESCLASLATYLSGEECQKQNYTELRYTPTNVFAMDSDDVDFKKVNLIEMEQAKNAVAIKYTHAEWWGLGSNLTHGVKNAPTTEGLEEVLNEYERFVEDILQKETSSESWSVIGDLNDSFWDVDFPLKKSADGYWISEKLYIKEGGQFKIRMNCSWSDPYFGENGAMGVNENLVAPASGYFRIKFYWNGVSDVATIEIIVEELVEIPDEPVETWSVIGTLGGTNWDKDFDMAYDENSKYWYIHNVVLNVGDQIKFRYAGSWDLNIGLKGYRDGENIIIATGGTYSIYIYFYENSGVYDIKFTTPEGNPVDPTDHTEAWSVIGTISGASWDKDFAMTQSEDGLWVSEVIHLERGDEFKIRKNMNWATNFGKNGVYNGPNVVVNSGGDYIIKFACGIDETSAYISLERQDESHGSEVTHSFSAEDLEPMGLGSKERGEILEINDYFNLHCSSNVSIVTCNTIFTAQHTSGGKIMLNKSPTRNDGVFADCISFSTTKTVTIRVWWENEAEGGQLALYNKQNDLLASSSEYSTGTGNTHVTVFDCFDPGIYYIGIRYNRNAPISIHKIEVIEVEHPDANNDFICDIAGCGLVVPPQDESTLTYDQASMIAISKYSNEYTCGRYYLTGSIVQLDPTYGDMTILGDDGKEFYIYGTLTEAGKIKYGDLPDGEKPVLGDIVTLLGTIGNYNGLIQMKKGYIIEYIHR